MASKQKSGGGSRKHGRGKNKMADQRYKMEMRWEKNAKRRQARHKAAVAKKRAKLEARREKAA